MSATELTMPRTWAGQSVIARRALPWLVLLVLWQVVAFAGGSDGVIQSLSSPTRVVGRAVDMLRDGSLLGALAASLSRALGGWLIGLVLAIPLGLLAGRSRLASGLLLGPVEMLRPISPILWVPLSLLWFGVSYAGQVFIVALITFFFVFFSTARSVQNVPQQLLDAARTHGASRVDCELRVVIPFSLPEVLFASRYVLTGAWGGVLVAEMAGASDGIGFLMLIGQARFDSTLIVLGMVVTLLVGLALDYAFRGGQRQLAPWSMHPMRIGASRGHGKTSRRRAVEHLVLTAVSATVLVSLWALASRSTSSIVLPGPTSVLSAGREMVTSGSFLEDARLSLMRVALGFALAALTGIGVGTAIASNRVVAAALEPILNGLKYVVPFAWLPIAAFWFGAQETGKVFIVWYGCFFVILFGTIEGIRSVNPLLQDAARTLGAGPLALASRITIPGSAQRILTSLRLGLAAGWIALMAAEMLATQGGLGYVISNARNVLETDMVIAGMLLIGILGALMSGIFATYERYRARRFQ